MIAARASSGTLRPSSYSSSTRTRPPSGVIAFTSPMRTPRTRTSEPG